MKLKELSSYLDSAIPLSFQENYDNSGLQLGLPDKETLAALLTLDITEDIINEAIETKCDLVISHHPLIFNGIKKITGKSSTERIINKCIRNDIAVYSSHTNLDIADSGVSRKIAEKIGLIDIKVLAPLEKRLLKLVTYIPEAHFEKVTSAIFEAGAGVIGNYDQCGYSVHGTGSFRGNDKTNPYVGDKGNIHFEREIRFETILFSHVSEKVIRALLDTHPYEEVAYDLYPLENKNINDGLGCTGKLPLPMDEHKFLNLISKIFDAKGIRYSKLKEKHVEKIAICGGSGISLFNNAVASGADAFITADIKYHNFFEAENNILLIDMGHFESEKYATEILKGLINKKFPKFAVRFSETNTNPINYL